MPLSLPEDTFLKPGEALGRVAVPGSKSITNRALLLAALAPGETRLRGGLEAEDTRWMREALRGLGVPLMEKEGEWIIQGGVKPRAQGPLWLGASGTTLRFLLPWLALCSDTPLRLEGEPRLFERPLGPLLEPLQILGAGWVPDPHGAWLHPVPTSPLGLDLVVDAHLSSQFLSGLALVAAALPEPSQLSWSEAASPSYLTLTARWLERFGCETCLDSGQWHIPGGTLKPQDLELPGDWSGAAVFIAAAAASGRTLHLGPLDPEDAQGDRAILAILEGAGCRFRWVKPRLLEASGPLLRGLDADLRDCPDLAPVLAALAALAPGPSELRGLQTLQLKECDRLEASADLVRWLGGQADVLGNHTLRIRPGQPLHPRPPFDPRRDHRMAFGAALGGLARGGELLDAPCVAKTFPEFWTVWRSMLGC